MALIKCEECGQMISDQVDVCPSCGAPVERKVKCTDCGYEMPDNVPSCPNCGCPNPLFNRKFEGVGTETVSIPQIQRVMIVGSDFYGNTGRSGKSRFTFFLLAIFFWWLGLQYFYVGKTGAGILNILCCFLFFFLIIPPVLILFLSLFAGYKALVMRQEEFEKEFVFTESSYPL